MTEKELLKSIRKTNALLEAIKEDQRITAEEIARVIDLPATKKQHELLQRLNKYQAQSIKVSTELVALKEKGKEIISKLTDKDEQAVLYLRYIDNKAWGQIAQTLPCSWATAFRIESRAFKHIKTKLKETD